MESKYLTPEKNLILRIIEQWGNAATMGEMEQWLKNYANSTKGQLVNALRQIEQMSDPGDYYKAICDMKSIATNALTGDESAAGREDAVKGKDMFTFIQWCFNEHPGMITKEHDEWYLADSTFPELYELFKQQKIKV